MKKIFGVLSALVALVSIALVFTALADLVSGTEEKPGVLIGLMVFFAGLAGGCGFFTYRVFRYAVKTKLSMDDIQKLVVSKARLEGGRLTLADVLSIEGLSVKTAKKILSALVDHGIAEIEVAENGAFVYRFPSAISDEEKKLSKGVLE